LVRVIFAGTTGLDKAIAIDKLIDKALLLSGNKPDHQNVNSQKFVRHFDFGEMLKQKIRAPLFTYFNLFEPEQRRKWSETLTGILDTIEKEGTKHVFLSLHSTFFHNSIFFSELDQDLISDFEPDLFVTFIDDTYAAWKRILGKWDTDKDPANSYLRLRDLLAWRTVEIVVTDLIAKNLGKPNYVVAVKHPVDSLFRMIFEPKTPFLYASFPISSTRRKPEMVKEIDEFRMKLYSKFVVFDPLTIDEKIIQSLIPLPKGQEEKEGIEETETQIDIRKEAANLPDKLDLESSLRWKFPEKFSMVDEDKLYPIKLEKEEIVEIYKDIDKTVENRDYRLVSDSDAVFAYRPWYGKETHRGVFSELKCADAENIPSWMYYPDEDLKDKTSPFAVGAIRKSLTDLYKAADNVKPRTEREWGGLK
jgi:hypothetical protein